MAFGTTIANSALILIDTFPGEVRRGWKPTADSDGKIFTNASHHKVSTPKYDPGFKVEAVDAVRGPAIFIYLQVGTMEAANGLAAGDMLGLQHTSGVLDGKITNDDDLAKVSLGGPGCMALSAWTSVTDNDKWGWFFCGGRVPITIVPDLDTTIGTDDSVLAVLGVALGEDDGVVSLAVAGATKLTIGMSAIVDS